MKKYIAVAVFLSFLSTLSWAQGTRPELFDVRKSQQELEIMKGILSTTLSFMAQNMQTANAPENIRTGGYARNLSGYRHTNISGFYLAGQGAVFVIPSSGWRLGAYGEALSNFYIDQGRLSDEVAAMARDIEVQARAQERIARGIQGGVSGMAGTGVAAPPKPDKPPTPPPPPDPASQAKQEDIRKRQQELSKQLAAVQEKTLKTRQDAEARRAKMLEALEQVRGFLIEALANHGDSITTVKPSEYINIVIMTDNLPGTELLGDDSIRNRQEIISVQKSWITDYKAGRMTLDAFKQKALQYEQ